MDSSSMFKVVSHYAFFEIGDPQAFAQRLRDAFQGLGVRGTILVASEGINLMLAGDETEIEAIVRQRMEDQGVPLEGFKATPAFEIPFKQFKVKVKEEIVTMGVAGFDRKRDAAGYVEPEAFRDLLSRISSGDLPKDQVPIVIDVRNDYETAVGHFEGALPAGTQTFREFPERLSAFPKDREIIMYCTGGIRCEKAATLARQQGFKHVRQLKGGVLEYLNRVGREHFVGTCFLFDGRDEI